MLNTKLNIDEQYESNVVKELNLESYTDILTESFFDILYKSIQLEQSKNIKSVKNGISAIKRE